MLLPACQVRPWQHKPFTLLKDDRHKGGCQLHLQASPHLLPTGPPWDLVQRSGSAGAPLACAAHLP